ncbi:probable mitochondrial import inner membrane translocase subunit Tim17 1 [Drosophila pseudoobscura]|uniref:Probable mitochondrial import inner membrane translocase subunit Tim17 1 n=1 Tax=Drosophila pseudoobscura pseudoobscura TaxID=46245 RepID=A0A6I8V369_DROPS|nr:probable mitochondrial import inner membrane translocase subunit Tim17 1 [Drosophila pseudoobscura]XP_033241590.1 probable mitochondrial import inner membrane translocase subunit Tim17 1 [Drosophila pseudoobscura]
MEREPCPFRLLEDCGGAFAIGALGGGLFQYLKGFRNAPTGMCRGLYGGLDCVKMKTPAIAGNFAVWAATYSTVDCAMVFLRQREDAWNSLFSGAATGGILAARQGLKGMMSSALVGGVLMGLIEGISILMTHQSADQFRQFSSRDRTTGILQQKTSFSDLYTNFTEGNPSSV